jgi:hypothetical protein
MAGLGNILVSIRATASEWASDIKSIQRDANELGKSLRPTQQLAQDMGTAFAVAGAAIVGSLTLMAKEAANYGDAIRDAAIRTNTTTEEMAAFSYLAQQSGTSVEALQRGLIILSRNAAAGADSFKRLGVDTKDSNGNLKSSKDLFGEVSQRLSMMADGTQKTALILSLFGRSGAELTEVLNGGKAALDGATAATVRFGTAIGQDAADQADKFNDTLNDMSQAQLGLSLAIGKVLLPVMTDLATSISNSIVAFQQWTNAHPALVQGLAGLGVALTGSGGVLLGISGVLAILPQLNKALLLLSGNPLVLTIAGFAGLVAAVIYFRQEIAMGVVAAFATFVNGLEHMLGAMQAVAGATGLTGLSTKLATAKFQLETFRMGLEDANAAAMEESRIIPATTKLLAAQESARKKHTIALLDDGKAAKKSAEEAKKLAEAWAQAFRTFKNSTSQLTPEVLDGLKRVEAAALKTAKAIVAANDEAFRSMVADQQYWARQSEAFSNASTAAVNANVEAAKRVNDGIAKDAIDKAAKVKADGIAQYQRLYDSVKATASRTFSDMFADGKFHFSALADAVKGIFATLWNQVLSELTAQLLTPLVGKISGALSGALGKVPGLGGIFGSAASGGASAAGAAGNAAGAAGSIGSSASSVGSAASGLAGTVTAIAGVGSLISGIIGNFQQARLEGTMNAVEFNTRSTALEVKDLIDQIMWPMKNSLVDRVEDYTHTMTMQLDAIHGRLVDGLAAVAAALSGDGKTISLVVDGRALATILTPHNLALSRNQAIPVVGTR